VTAEEIIAFFDGWELDAEERAYLTYHARRYEFLLDRVDALVEGELSGEPLRVLDVGLGFQTMLLRDRLPRAEIESIGLPVPRFLDRGVRHVWLDLNDLYEEDRRPDIGGYDLAIAAEVLEHLHTAPATILGCLAGWLRPGGFVLVQTPNAVALHKRLRMLAGRVPFGPVPETREDPAHWREYTAGELAAAAGAAGLEPVELDAANYFGGSGRARLYAALGRALPRGMRHGLTLTLQKPS
jgi:SAM-dependent methyltransferase